MEESTVPVLSFPVSHTPEPAEEMQINPVLPPDDTVTPRHLPGQPKQAKQPWDIKLQKESDIYG